MIVPVDIPAPLYRRVKKRKDEDVSDYILRVLNWDFPPPRTYYVRYSDPVRRGYNYRVASDKITVKDLELIIGYRPIGGSMYTIRPGLGYGNRGRKLTQRTLYRRINEDIQSCRPLTRDEINADND